MDKDVLTPTNKALIHVSCATFYSMKKQPPSSQFIFQTSGWTAITIIKYDKMWSNASGVK